MDWQIVIVLLIAIPVILFPAAFVWHLTAGGIYHAVREARKRRAIAGQPGLFSRILPVLIIIGKALPVVAGIAVYVVGITYFFGQYGWPVALAFTLAVPVIIVPVVMVWYLNASGIFQVMLASRRRRARLARAGRAELSRVAEVVK